MAKSTKVGGKMPSRSEHGWLSAIFRKRKSVHAVSSVSAFVQTMDKGEADTRPDPPRLVSATLALPHASNEMSFRPAARASRAQQLEAENIRLRQMVSDLMLETEILRSTMRRNLGDVNSMAAR